MRFKSGLRTMSAASRPRENTDTRLGTAAATQKVMFGSDAAYVDAIHACKLGYLHMMPKFVIGGCTQTNV